MIAAATVMLDLDEERRQHVGQHVAHARRARASSPARARIPRTPPVLMREHGAAREAEEGRQRGAIPIAIMALVRLGPRKAASAMATMRNGMASMASVTRMMRPSTQPPA